MTVAVAVAVDFGDDVGDDVVEVEIESTKSVFAVGEDHCATDKTVVTRVATLSRTPS